MKKSVCTNYVVELDGIFIDQKTKCGGTSSANFKYFGYLNRAIKFAVDISEKTNTEVTIVHRTGKNWVVNINKPTKINFKKRFKKGK